MNLQKSSVIAAGRLAIVSGIGQYTASGGWWNRRFVALAPLVDLAMALRAFQLTSANLQFAFAGLHRCRFALWTMVNMDLG